MVRQSLKKEDIPQLIQELVATNDEVRSEAAEDLGICGVFEAVPNLIPLLADPVDKVRASATFALTELASNLWERPIEFMPPNGTELEALIKQIVIPKFIDLISDPCAEVRTESIQGLHDLRIRQVVPQLISALNDTETSVCITAAKALGTLGDESALPALRNLLTKSRFHGQTAKEARKTFRNTIKLIEERIRKLSSSNQ